MKKTWVKILLGLVVLIIIAGILAVVFIGTIVKSGVEKVGPMVAKVPVTLESAAISIFGGSGSLKGFVIGNPEGFKTAQAIKVDKVSVSIAPGSVLKEKKHIRSIVVEAPDITYETDLRGSNLGKILDNVSGSASQDEKAPTKDEQTTKTKLQVDEFVITGAKVTVSSAMVGSATIPLPEIRLNNLGQGPEGITPAELSKKVLTLVLNETTKAVAGNLNKLTDPAKALGTGATDQLKKGASGLGDLLKKKEK
ncbi:MAG TPA: hypothetical protein VK530_12235 [Candidatus Acidoferrum sp.]|nr:hypothetical protein [Candidatus Acidoferrum sp.]